MASYLLPWRWWQRDSSSPASFEKTLSSLSAKITNTQAQLEATRARSRRIKVLYTLYLTFVYLVYAVVSFLVIGKSGLSTYEWSGIAGGPVLIYLVRLAVVTYYNYRIDTLEKRLQFLRKDRSATIQQLKDATKYNSTLALIEKYGGEDGNPKKPPNANANSNLRQKRKSGTDNAHPQQQAQRLTSHPPPPTANIVRKPTDPSVTPNGPPNEVPVTEEFAPNDYALRAAAVSPSQLHHHSEARHPHQNHSSVHAAPAPSHWYDRILDLLLGEDEKEAKNRIVLLCKACRLVNGQAPPGTTSLAEVGTWRCSACHTLNGEEDESLKLLHGLQRGKAKAHGDRHAGASSDDEDADGEDEETASELRPHDREENSHPRNASSSPLSSHDSDRAASTGTDLTAEEDARLRKTKTRRGTRGSRKKAPTSA